jgi:hypothetical protein
MNRTLDDIELRIYLREDEVKRELKTAGFWKRWLLKREKARLKKKWFAEIAAQSRGRE